VRHLQKTKEKFQNKIYFFLRVKSYECWNFPWFFGSVANGALRYAPSMSYRPACYKVPSVGSDLIGTGSGRQDLMDGATFPSVGNVTKLFEKLGIKRSAFDRTLDS